MSLSLQSGVTYTVKIRKSGYHICLFFFLPKISTEQIHKSPTVQSQSKKCKLFSGRSVGVNAWHNMLP